VPRPDPHSSFDPAQGKIEHIDFTLNLDFESRVVRGLAHYRLGGRGATGTLDLDCRSLAIKAVRDAAGAPVPWTLSGTGGFMGELLSIRLAEGAVAFSAEFETSPEASALPWLEPSNPAGGTHPFLFSQCQPIHARSVFPCQDSPAVRFSYTAAVTAPEALTPVMSAAPGVAGPIAGGTRVHTFEMPQPIPSYLFALAAGRIEARDLGPRTRVYAEPETLDAAAWEFAEVNGMLAAAEGLFGPYLWDRFDFIVMPPAFPYGGMENPRLTFLTPTLLAKDRSLTNVLAHELAHSWTGNLVTNATMNDFWLNEGFTVWAERRINEALEGEQAAALSAALGRIGLNDAVAQFGADSPHTRLQTDLAGIDPDSVYSLVPYEKGFLFVARLEELLGRERMDAFVQEYIGRFRFRSITTADFEAFAEETHPGLLDSADAARWIHGTGVPADAPIFESPRLDELRRMASAWGGGGRPGSREVAAWSTAETLVFMGELPRRMTATECAELVSLLGLDDHENSEILCAWLVIAATSGYEPAFGRIAGFLGAVGRMKYLKPIYSALAKGEGTLDMAREIYRRNRGKYHPIARGGLERILGLNG